MTGWLAAADAVTLLTALAAAAWPHHHQPGRHRRPDTPQPAPEPPAPGAAPDPDDTGTWLTSIGWRNR